MHTTLLLGPLPPGFSDLPTALLLPTALPTHRSFPAMARPSAYCEDNAQVFTLISYFCHGRTKKNHIYVLK